MQKETQSNPISMDTRRGGGLSNGLCVFNRVEFRENVKAPRVAWN